MIFKMNRRRAERIFPEEVLDQYEAGVPLPVWYSGPYYDENRGKGALEQLRRLKAQTTGRRIIDLEAEIEELAAPLPAEVTGAAEE
jgi:hypothetical protein